MCSRVVAQIVVLEDPDMESEDILRRNRAHERRYAFDKVFGEECDQHHVYSSINRYLIDAILAGINATVFAYGATGAGKTFTMCVSAPPPASLSCCLSPAVSPQLCLSLFSFR
jgi:kinesin family member 18/19